jgi:osmoprotectant transport system permease protein
MRDPLLLTTAALVLVLGLMPYAAPLFAALFPAVERPLYVQDSMATLALDHLALVLAASGVAAVIGIGLAVFVTRAAGRAFRGVIETLVAVGQTIPPVAVLALAVPAIGFGPLPALIALALYGLLPIVQSALAGLDGVAPAVREAAEGMGLSPLRRLVLVELPLAAPLALAGLRSAVVVNVGTATIASAVGVRTLGTPIILGLNGNNTAYVVQGAIPVALLAIVLDLALGRLARVTSAARVPA